MLSSPPISTSTLRSTSSGTLTLMRRPSLSDSTELLLARASARGLEPGGRLLVAAVLGRGDIDQVHGELLACVRWLHQHRAERLLARYRGEMRRDKHVDSVTEVPWPASEQLMRRQRWYFLLMGVCLTLIVLAWTWVRLWSVPLAVGMSAVAAVIPPIAAFVGSNGVRGG